MAFRRQRIKAVANVALRRNKDATEDTETLELVKDNESEVQLTETSAKKIDVKSQSDNVNDSEYSSELSIKTTDVSNDMCFENSVHTTNVLEYETTNVSNSSVSEVENVKTEPGDSTSSYIRSDSNNVVLPIRKRIRPAVRLLPVNRKTKDVIVDTVNITGDKSLSTTNVESEVRVSASSKDKTPLLHSSDKNCDDNNKVLTCERTSDSPNKLLSNIHVSLSKNSTKLNKSDLPKSNGSKFNDGSNYDGSSDQLPHDDKRLNLLHNNNSSSNCDLIPSPSKAIISEKTCIASPCLSGDKIKSFDTNNLNCKPTGKRNNSNNVNDHCDKVLLSDINRKEYLDVTEVACQSTSDIGVGVPISDCSIPTGTSVRHQKNSCINDTLNYGIDNNTQSIPEADIPTECAVTEDCGLAKIPPAPTNAINVKSRLHRFVPKIQANRSRRPKTITDTVSSEKSLKCASTSNIAASSQEPIPECGTEETTGAEQTESDHEDNSNLVYQKPVDQLQKEQQDSAHKTLENVDSLHEPSVLYKKLQNRQKNAKTNLNKVVKKKNVLSKCKKTTKKSEDKSKIGIFDLVFSHYREIDPLSKTPSLQQPSQSDVLKNIDVEQRVEEESVDDVASNENITEEENKENEDEETAVPQVKLDADGNIIVDTDSLVVETTAAKRSREVLKNASIIIDTGSSSYHMYGKKRRLKTKEWSPQETLRFFHALRAVGTDFSMMQTLFPNRTRIELKLKFKKEERTNSDLITEAFNKPFAFDFEQLERECEKDKLEEEKIKERVKQEFELKEKIKEKKKLLASEKNKNKNKKKRKKCHGMHYFDISDDDDDTTCNRENHKEEKMQEEKKRELFKEIKENEAFQEIQQEIIGIESDSECESSDISYSSDDGTDESKKRKIKGKKSLNDSEDEEMRDSEDEVKGIRRELMYLQKAANPTRSGRIPKRSFANDETNSIELIDESYPMSANKENYIVETSNGNCEASNACETNDVCEKRSSLIMPRVQVNNPSFEKLQPGSLLVLSAPSPDNPSHHLYKFFMVAPPNVPPNAGNNSGTPVETSDHHRKNTVTGISTEEIDI